MLQTGKGFFLVCILLLISVCYIFVNAYTIKIGDKYLPKQYVKTVNSVNPKDLEGSSQKLRKQAEELEMAGYGYSDYQVLKDVCEEIENVKNYPELLQQLKNAFAIQTLSSLSESSYEQKSKENLSKQYEHLDSKNVAFIGSRGITLFLETDFCDVFLSLIIMLLALSLLTTEYEGKMLSLLNSSQLGLRRIAAAKGAVGLLMTFFITLFLNGVKLLIYSQAYGFSEWGGRIQSVYGYASSSFSGNILEFISLFFASKVFGYMVLFGCFYLLASLCRKSWKFLAASGVFLAVSGIWEWQIDENSWLLVLKRFNPLTYIQGDYLLSKYRDINLFGQPVSYLLVWCLAGVFFLILCLTVGILKFGGFQMEFGKQFHADKLSDFFFDFSDKLKLHTFFLWEWRKSWLGERGIVVFCLGCCLAVFLHSPIEESLETQDEVYFKEYISQVQGPYTPEKKQNLEKEKKRLTKLEDDIAENGSSYTQQALDLYITEIERLPALDMVIEYVDYLKGVPEGWLVYERGYEMLFGQEIPGSYLKLCDVLAVFLMLVLCIPVWGMEEWTGMDRICIAAPYGLQEVRRAKKKVVLLYSTLVFALVYIPWIYNIVNVYPVSGQSAAIQSIRLFSGISINLPIGALLGIYYFLHFIYLVFVGRISSFLQKILHGYAITGMVGIAIFLIPFLFLN